MPPDGPLDRWTEAALAGLEPHEHDFQEFKGSGWVCDENRVIRDHFPIYLSKQVSAFANAAGGRLYLGVDDEGRIDGGIPVDLRGGGTRAWLEDMVHAAVDPALARCNVFEIPWPGEGPPTQIRPGRAVYVIDLPASEDAPHQAKDHRYYLRIAGKSRPMGNLHVQDVIRRGRHPRVALSRLGPYGEPDHDPHDPRGPQALIQLRAFVTNLGRSLAHHVGVELIAPRPFCGREVRRRMRDKGDTHMTQSPGNVTFFRYHPMPLFPSQEIYVTSIWLSLHGNNLQLARGEARLSWVVYADDAIPVEGSRPLSSFQIVGRAADWVERQSPRPETR